MGCIEEVALGVPADGGCTLDHLPMDGVHAPALTTLPVHGHLALCGEEQDRCQREETDKTNHFPGQPAQSPNVDRAGVSPVIWH